MYREREEPLEEPSPIPQKEPVASSEPFSGEIIPGMLCVAEYATNTLAVVDARAGEVAGAYSRRPQSGFGSCRGRYRFRGVYRHWRGDRGSDGEPDCRGPHSRGASDSWAVP